MSVRSATNQRRSSGPFFGGHRSFGVIIAFHQLGASSNHFAFDERGHEVAISRNPAGRDGRRPLRRHRGRRCLQPLHDQKRKKAPRRTSESHLNAICKRDRAEFFGKSGGPHKGGWGFDQIATGRPQTTGRGSSGFERGLARRTRKAEQEGEGEEEKHHGRHTRGGPRAAKKSHRSAINVTPMVDRGCSFCSSSWMVSAVLHRLAEPPRSSMPKERVFGTAQRTTAAIGDRVTKAGGLSLQSGSRSKRGKLAV